MATQHNPLYSQPMLPGGNPTGQTNTVNNPLDFVLPSQAGANPLLPTTNLSPTGSTNPSNSPLSAGFSFPANGQPVGTPGAVPMGSSTLAVGADSKTPGSIGYGSANMFGFNLLPPDQMSSMLHTLSKTFGPGVGDALFNFLKTGAGYNQDVVNQLIQSVFSQMQPGIERGAQNIMEQFSTSGNRFSSPASIGLGDYFSQVNLNEGTIASEMEYQAYNQALTNYMNILTGTGKETASMTANSPSIWDTISSALGLTKSLAGAAGAGLTAAGAGGAGAGILAGLAAV